MQKQVSVSARDEHLMTLAELAKYLSLGENTILTLATQQSLPGVQVDKQWRFERKAVEHWIETQGTAEYKEISQIPDGLNVPLGDLLPLEAIVSDLRAKDPLTAIQELAICAFSNNWINDKPWLIDAVAERESLASTAMEGGVAFMHTRSRDSRKIERPFIVAGRSYSGVDLGAPDGKKTYLLFLLGLKFDQLHLPILARLARILRSPKVVAKLRAAPSPSEMRALLLREDAQAIASSGRGANQNARANTVGNPILPSAAAEPSETAPALDRKSRLRAIMRVNAIRKHSVKKAQEAEEKAEKKAEKAPRETGKERRSSSRSEVGGCEGKSGSSKAEDSCQKEESDGGKNRRKRVNWGEVKTRWDESRCETKDNESCEGKSSDKVVGYEIIKGKGGYKIIECF